MINYTSLSNKIHVIFVMSIHLILFYAEITRKFIGGLRNHYSQYSCCYDGEHTMRFCQSKYVIDPKEVEQH